MYIYIATFFVSALLLYISEHFHRKSLQNVLEVIAIVIPAILAGCRAQEIGTDVSVYGKPFYDAAVNSASLREYFFSQSNLTFMEPAFYGTVFLASRFCKDYHLGLFVYELLTVTFAYAAMKRCSRLFKTPLWFGMLLYDLVLYNVSLNIMRQSIAVSVVFLAVTYLFENRYKTYAFLLVLAFGFHSSAIISVIVFPMYVLLGKKQSTETKALLIRLAIFLTGILFIVSVGSSTVQFLVNQGILRLNYLKYLEGGIYTEETSRVSIMALAPHLIYIGLGAFHFRRLSTRKRKPMFFMMASGLAFLSCFGTLLGSYITRIGYYFVPLEMVLLANMSDCYHRKSRWIWYGSIIILLFLFWYWNFVVKGIHETVPYRFFWNE